MRVSGSSSAVESAGLGLVAAASGQAGVVPAELVPEPGSVPVESGSEAAAARLAEVLSPGAVRRLAADAEEAGIGLDGPDGLLNQLTKAGK